MDSVSKWRTAIGIFAGGRGYTKVSKQNTNKQTVTTKKVLLLFLLLLCGDVETNPGPTHNNEVANQTTSPVSNTNRRTRNNRATNQTPTNNNTTTTVRTNTDTTPRNTTTTVTTNTGTTPRNTTTTVRTNTGTTPRIQDQLTAAQKYELELRARNELEIRKMELEARERDKEREERDKEREERDKERTAKLEMRKLEMEHEIALRNQESTSNISVNGSNRTKAKLPKLEIPTFNGDPINYQDFKDQFDASVDSNTALSNVEKFSYLKQYLCDEAAQAISGMPHTAANYEVAKKLIEERFGKKQLVIFSHFMSLFKLNSATNKTESLRLTYDVCTMHIRCLEALNVSRESFGIVFVPLMLSKLTDEVRLKLYSKNGNTDWTLDNLLTYLQDEIVAKENTERIAKVSLDSTKGKDRTKNMFPMSTANALMQQTRPTCIFCSKNHSSSSCRTFSDYRSRQAQINHLCQKCLSNDHASENCQDNGDCFFCKSTLHHYTLCPIEYKSLPIYNNNRFRSNGRQQDSGFNNNRNFKPNYNRQFSNPMQKSHVAIVPDAENRETTIPEKQEMQLQHTMLSNGDQTFSQTAIAEISNSEGSKYFKMRILLDSAASRSFITKEAVHRINAYPTEEHQILINGFEEGRRRKAKYSCVNINLKFSDQTKLPMSINVTDVITAPIEKIPLPEPFPITNIRLADPPVQKATDVPLDILIGQDYYYDIVTGAPLRFVSGLVLIDSRLGYITGGCERNKISSSHCQNLICLAALNKSELSSTIHIDNSSIYENPKSLDKQLENFHSLESIGISDWSTSDEDSAIEQFNESVKKVDNRYEVTWLWRSKFPKLPNNFNLACNRLKTLITKFKRTPGFLEKYNNVFITQEQKDMIEEVTDNSETGELKHYLSHHGVLKDSLTTPLRIVFDASAKAASHLPSLNECLLHGPSYIGDLCGFLLRARLHPILLLSDIEKAYLQISLKPSERDVTRFLWFADPENPSMDNIKIYRFKRVAFGIISSAALLAMTILHHLKKYSTPTAKELTKAFYVDNVLIGKNSAKESVMFYSECKKIFQEASMNIREWTSNSKEFMDSIPNEDRATSSKAKILGLPWDILSDNIILTFNSKMRNIVVKTKRQLVQAASTLYDPLGLLAPLTIKSKLLMQTTWKEKLKWESKLPDKLLVEWENIVNDMSDFEIRIPRYIGSKHDQSKKMNYELHIFADASKLTYAATAYLRISSPDVTTTHLIMSKQRLSPVKSISLPRLELLAIYIASKLAMFLIKELRIEIKRTVIWSDSKCALFWIKSSKLMSTFIENRLRDIRALTKTIFRYVPTKDNPADIPTRGCTASELKSSILWWYGPSWLCCIENEWPENIEITEDSADDSEERQSNKYQSTGTITLVLPIVESLNPPFGIDHQSLSSLQKLLRITGWALRFIKKCRNLMNCDVKYLTIAELSEALVSWERYVQDLHFSDIKQLLKQCGQCPLIRQLQLFLDNEGLIRCGGRLKNSCLNYDQIHPKLLPNNDWFTKLIVLDCHARIQHGGISHTLNTVREGHWIPHGRTFVRNIIRKCPLCRKHQARPYAYPPSPPLPSFRCRASAPFSHVGIDFFGPLFIRIKNNGEHLKKVYVCLFTCAAIRAIHLELVQNLSVEEFLLAFKRFVSIRGKPSLIISDNAKTFTSGYRCLSEVWNNVLLKSDEVHNYTSNARIEWKFITPYSPWFGGFYERLVGIVKTSLKKALNKQLLNYVELQTILSEVCAIVNSRPLTHVNSEPSSDIVLTPAHFLMQNTETGIPFHEFSERCLDQESSNKQNLLQKWNAWQNKLNIFWKVWHNDYLTCLRERQDLNHRKSNILQPKCNDIVLLKEKNIPRAQWRLGKIIELCRSSDDLVRTAKVKMGKNVLERPISFLCPLEI